MPRDTFVDRSHHARLSGVRDAVAPPGALAFASVGVVIASVAATGVWWRSSRRGEGRESSPGQGLLVVTAQGRSRELVLSAVAAQQGRIVEEVPQTETYLMEVVPERQQAALRAFIDAGSDAMPLPGGNPIGTGEPDRPR